MTFQLRRVAPNEVEPASQAVLSPSVLETAAEILERVRIGGQEALWSEAIRLGDLDAEAREALVLDRQEIERRAAEVSPEDRALLERVADRIRVFAEAQRESLAPLETEVVGGRAGHEWSPVDAAGCYAPGGRYPLPSSVLMTAITAKAAGVPTVVVASPRPAPITFAAAAVAGADLFLSAGGAQAIAAFTYGAGAIPACDVIVGPGNAYVTAAKKLVAGATGIDMLAGPSELLVLCDETAEVRVVAADLLAQAEHDPDARVVVVTTASEDWLRALDLELDRQLLVLETAEVARQSMQHALGVRCETLAEACTLCDRLAPEHLQVLTREPSETARTLRHYGALFLGRHSAEVFGDYGVGPNHVLPTGGSARHSGGLSVLQFLRLRTWLQLDRTDPGLREDVARLASLEGLHGHRRAAELRL